MNYIQGFDIFSSNKTISDQTQRAGGGLWHMRIVKGCGTSPETQHE